jgi:50S ribosomal subunit-associated GTPase HflX
VRGADAALLILDAAAVARAPAAHVADVPALVDADALLLLNKADSAPGAELAPGLFACAPRRVWLASVRTGAGMREFVDGLAAELRTRFACGSLAHTEACAGSMSTRSRATALPRR